MSRMCRRSGRACVGWSGVSGFCASGSWWLQGLEAKKGNCMHVFWLEGWMGGWIDGGVDLPEPVDGPGVCGTCRRVGVPKLGLQELAARVVEAAGIWDSSLVCAAEWEVEAEFRMAGYCTSTVEQCDLSDSQCESRNSRHFAKRRMELEIQILYMIENIVDGEGRCYIILLKRRPWLSQMASARIVSCCFDWRTAFGTCILYARVVELDSGGGNNVQDLMVVEEM